MAEPVTLKNLLRQKHWQTYSTFCMQYDKAARAIDDSLVGSYPSRAQLHRWQAGDLKGLPYPRHCQVLEAMFPGITVAQMFTPAKDNAEPTTDISGHIARPVVILGSSTGLSEAEIAELGKLVGNLVDFKMECSIDIDTDGWASVAYCHQVANLTNRPMKRMTREQWFETTSGPLKIEPCSSSDRKVYIQRIHDTANMSKFACQFSPAIEPGEIATISYASRGGRFVHDHYWRQSVSRHTRHFTLKIRHRGVAMLFNCTAIEERIDGSEISAIEDLVCSDEDDGALITLTREHLQPGQAVTVRWEVSHAVS
ncbi:MAG: hypothetical protein ACRDTG_04685 [Pseudonocardiaceae bacterium]